MVAAKALGPLLIAAAAMLWATDAPFRVPALQAIEPTWVVFAEHLVGVLVLAVWVLVARRKDVFALRPIEFAGIVLIGSGGSALASLLFTASFRYVNPSVTILLQKLQPVLVVALARLFLKEKPKAGFYRWATLALAAAAVLSFPNLDFGAFSGGFDVHSRGVAYALAAAALWAVTTVVGKALLGRLSAGTVTFWRYVAGLMTLALLIGLLRSPFPEGAIQGALDSGHWELGRALLYMSLGPGLLGMVLYYQGLFRTPATVATFAELVYPVSAIAINTWVLHTALDPIQAAASAALLLAVTRISFLK